jgi:membrane protease YdiL (CAAX protease family)
MSRTAIAAPASNHARLVPDDYLEASARPWHSLLLVLPLVVAYEVGTALFTRDAAGTTETRIIAFTMLQRFLAGFGATKQYLPAAAVVIVLFTWHLARRDPWTCKPRVLGGMVLESICWSAPLLLLAVLMARFVPLQGIASGSEYPLAKLLVLSLGAGVYEELVFRLAFFALVSLVLTDFMGISKHRTAWVALVVGALLFSLYHYLGWEEPNWRTFVFRFVAGIFFGLLYMTRGFGITAGAHAAYDVLVHLLRS